MPAIDSLLRPDVQTVPAGAQAPPPDSQVAAGAPASGGAQFGDVLSNSISTSSSVQSGPQSGAQVPPPGGKASAPQPAAQPVPQTSPAPARGPDGPAVKPDAAPQPNSAGTSDPQALLAASLAAAAVVQIDKAPAADPIATAPAGAGQPANASAPSPGSAPAQLINSLLQSQAVAAADTPAPDVANSSDTGSVTTAAIQAGAGTAPKGLLAALDQIQPPTLASATDTLLNSTHLSETAASSIPPNPESNNVIPAPVTVEPPAVTILPVAPNVVTIAATTTTIAQILPPQPPVSKAVISQQTGAAAGGNSMGETQSGSPGETIAPVVATGINVSISSLPPATGGPPNPGTAGNASSSDARPASEVVTFPGAGPAPMDATLANSIAGALPANQQGSTSTVPDVGNGNQNSVSTDTSAGAGQPGIPNPGVLPFGAAPASLQLNSTVGAGGQAAPLASINPAQVIEQVTYALQLTHSSGQQMQLHLNPPQLGALQVDVSFRDGVMSARLEAQTSTTQQILVDNLSQLKESLTQQGVNFDRIDVRLAGSGTGSSGSGSTDPSFSQQPEGGLPWEQPPAASDNSDPIAALPAPGRPDFRKPLTSLDVMI